MSGVPCLLGTARYRCSSRCGLVNGNWTGLELGLNGRVAGAALFGWSRSRFIGPAPAPTPTPTPIPTRPVLRSRSRSEPVLFWLEPEPEPV